MKLSIVVPAFNEEALLPESLSSIRAAMAAFAERGWPAELIVCDNNSTDRTADIAREAGAIVVFEPVNQIARARNSGARTALGEWLVFIDADSWPSRELFAAVCGEIESGVLAGGATVAYRDAPLSVRIAIGVWNRMSRINRWAAGSFIFCEAAAFREVGGFSEELYAGEEIDLFGRLKRLARRKRRPIRILHRHPLRTSDRKVGLYGWRPLLAFMGKTIVTGGRNLRSREDCYTWYDGRR